MEIKEVILEVQRLVKRKQKIKNVKEEWYVVEFGEREFLMPKEVCNYLLSKIYKGSCFDMYFDGDKVFTDDEYHVPVGNNREVKEYTFIFEDENTEFWKPGDFTLVAKNNGFALYTTEHDKYILYRNGKKYNMLDYPRTTFTFETEKPLDEETFNLIKRLHSDWKKAKYIKINGSRVFADIRVLDYDEINIYTVEKSNEHQIIAIENAELVKIAEDVYIAIKGNKTYLGIIQFYSPIESDFTKIKKVIITYKSKHKMFEYIILDLMNVVKKEKYTKDKHTVGYKSIVEIPSLDSEIIVRTLIKNAEPILTDIVGKLKKYEETNVTVENPIELDYSMLEPELVEEKTYNVRDFLSKPVEVGY